MDSSQASAIVKEPSPGVLYLVGTPIGHRGDLSPRAQQLLAAVDRVACEDTRHSGLLLHGLGIQQKLISFHQHNQQQRIPELLQALADGEALALISDAGLPGISDPGEGAGGGGSGCRPHGDLHSRALRCHYSPGEQWLAQRALLL